MNPTFNVEEFERLEGRPLGIYASQVSAGGNVPAEFLRYFIANSASWDGQRLEAALSLLGALDSESARHQVADFLDHPKEYIRLLVIRLLDQMESVDTYVLSRIEERLSETHDEIEMRGLRRIRERANRRARN